MRTEALLPLASIAFTWLVGCGGAPSRPPLMAQMTQRDVTVSRLRAMDYEYAARFGQMVAAAALDIIERAEDAEVRDRAYQWRMWAMPQARAAAFDQDPFAGLLELWVLARQQHEYLTEGRGSQAFADQQELAVATSAELLGNVRKIAASTMEADRFERLSQKIDAWITNHPMEGRFFVRPTARADLAALVSEQSRGGLKAVGSIEETFRDLNDRLTILTSQLPEEARWQAEYLVNALFEERFRDHADSLVDAMQGITVFLGELEGTLDARTTELLERLRQERIAIFESIGQERDIILAGVEEQRLSMMTEVDAQLITTTAKLDEVGRGLIDHFFTRLIEVLAAMGLFVLATMAVVLVVVRKRRARED